MTPTCERCGPRELPVAMVEMDDGVMVCLRCALAASEKIAPRKAEKPAPFVRGKVPSEWLGGGK